MKKLILENISKKFNEQLVLKNISFEVGENDFLVLVGPSGCGKTTLLRIISGLEQPTTGKIIFDGQLWNDIPPGDRNVGMVFQNYSLYPHLNVFDNLAFPLTIKKVKKSFIKRRVVEIAKMLQLENKLYHKPKELSGGERQRVALGRAIIRQPNIFLFDEPLSNLDAKLRVLMRTEIVNLVQQLQIPSIYVTHDQIEALTMGTKVAVLKEGEIQQIGTPKEVYYKPANTFVATFIGSPQMNLFYGTVVDEIFYEKNGLFRLNLKETQILDKITSTDSIRHNKELILGIRPEDLQPTNTEPGKIITMINTYEYTGYDVIVYFGDESNLYSFITKETNITSKTKKQIHLDFNPQKIHLFDQGGKRIN